MNDEADFQALLGDKGQPQNVEQAAPSGDEAEFAALINKQPEQSSFMDMVDSFNNSTRKLANGALQPIAAILDKVGATRNASAALAQDTAQYQSLADKAYASSPKAAAIGNFAGDLAKVGYTAAATGGLGFGGYAAPNAVARMGQQGLLAATTAGAEYGSLSERGQAAGAAGAVGAGAQGLLGELVPFAYQGAKEGVKNLANRAFTGSTPEAAAAALNAGQKLTAGMATGNEAIQTAEGYLAQLPLVGAKGNYKAIANQVDEQAKGFLGSQGLNVGEEAIENASMGNLATSIVDEAGIAERQARSLASGEYQKFRDIAGTTPIPMTQAGKVADEALNSQAAKEGYAAADISGTKEGKILQSIQSMGQATPKTFETIRQDLGAAIKDIKKGGGDSRLLPILSQVKEGLDADLTNFGAQAGGAIETQLKTARDTYSNLVGPFKNEPILKRIKAGNVTPDELLNAATMGDKPNTAQTLMKNLTPKGKEDYSKALLLSAAENSFAQGTNKFSARKFGIALSNMGETFKALPKETQDKISGIKTVISRADDVLKEAGKKRVFAPGISAGVAFGSGGFWGLLGAAGATKALSYMLTNPKMVKQLVRLGGGELNEKTSTSTIKYIMDQVGRTFDPGRKAVQGAVANETEIPGSQ